MEKDISASIFLKHAAIQNLITFSHFHTKWINVSLSLLHFQHLSFAIKPTLWRCITQQHKWSL